MRLAAMCGRRGSHLGLSIDADARARWLGASVALLACALLVTPAAASAAATLDQQQTVTSGGPEGVVGGIDGGDLAQTFTAGISGALDHVELFLSRGEFATLPLSVEIRTVSGGGEPGEIVLASAMLPSSSVSSRPSSAGTWVPVAFTVPAQVVAGTQYAIVLETANFEEGYYWSGSSGNPYAGGSAWLREAPSTEWEHPNSVGDFAFKTYVTPPPKPTTLTTELSGEGHKGAQITVKEGAGVTDQATLSGENASKAAGTVSYNVYSDNQCSKLVKAAGTVTVTSGSAPASTSETLSAGTYYWQAAYSGDENNEKSASVCGSEIETVTAKPATCGKTTIGRSSDTLLSNEKRVNACVLPLNATVTELSVYLAPTGYSGKQLIKGIVYSSSAGKPATRLGVTQALTFKSSDPPGWYHLLFATPLKLSAASYWIGIITGEASRVAGERYDSVANAEHHNPNTYTSGPSTKFGPYSSSDEQMSLYATYTPG